jgi:NADPH:quinone reductase-like Zn-dependent oxidoreductase
VGTFAIQLAKHLGATVATTTSTANVELVKSLGADVVVDYKKQDFEKILSGYDVVLNSLDSDTLQKSLSVLKPGGKLISISGPPDPDFARDQGLNWFLRQVLRLLSFGIRRKAKRRRISYSFLFMRANGAQLSEITSLIETGIIRPVMDRVFPFEAINDALAYIEAGRSKGQGRRQGQIGKERGMNMSHPLQSSSMDKWIDRTDQAPILKSDRIDRS